MNELVSRVAAAAGVSEDTARKAVGVILAFVQKEGAAAPVAEMMAKIPGAAELASEAGEAGDGGGGMLGALGGMMGGGGLMALAGKLGGLGIGMGDMQGVGQAIFGYAREKAGEDVVGRVAGSIPGLSQFV
jgi:hypothetical protein